MRVICALAALALAVACGPSAYVMDMEMRYPSRSGVDLAGKNVAVMYDAGQGDDARSVAEAFINEVGNSYGGAIDSVSLFSLPDASDYACRDSLIRLVIETGSDVVFLFDRIVKPAESEEAEVSLRCYDSMYEGDKMLSFTGSSLLPLFQPQWKAEQYFICCYSGEKWVEAAVKADMYDWKGAVELWMLLLDTENVQKRSCAEYNIALACYMTGDYELALRWLDRSDKDCPLDLSRILRKRIMSRM